MGLWWGGCKCLNVRFTWNLLSWSCDTSFIFPQLCHVSLRWCNHSPLLLSLSAMATYPPTCSNTNTSQGMNMANSIANLRLKAKEYSLNQVPTVNWEEGERLGGGGAGGEGTLSAVGPLQTGHRLWDENHLNTPTEPRSLLHLYAKMLDSEWCRIFPPSRLLFFFILIFFFTSSWASLNSRLYKKKTSLLDAVAEYLRSFYMCDCDWSGGRVFHFCCFPISELVLDGDAWTDYVDFSSSLQLWDKITHQVRDFSFFFLLESTTNWHRLLTFMHFF